MEEIKFEWDENKNDINKKKHRISFEEAKTVFYDENALVINDPEHSQEEDRFIILGVSDKTNLLVVCHCYRESDSVIRIISARKATTTETNQYNNFQDGDIMREEYDFSNAKRNPYAKKLKKQITINIDIETVDYFKKQSEISGIPYQTLINLYLTDCVNSKRELQLTWK